MSAFDPVSHSAHSPEVQVGIWAATALGGYGIWRLLRRMFAGPRTPDPWDDTVAAEIETDAARPLCHRCLAPHLPAADFCPRCGATVGQYTNWLPYPYIFSVGHTLRLGTSGDFKRSRLTVAGFFLFSFAEYALMAPIYWIVLLVNLQKSRRPRAAADAPAAPPTG